MSSADNDAKDYYHQTDPQYKLRWPLELKEKIAQSAKEHNRSINAEICTRLENSFAVEEEGVIMATEATQKILADAIHQTINNLVEGLLVNGVDKEKLASTLTQLKVPVIQQNRDD